MTAAPMSNLNDLAARVEALTAQLEAVESATPEFFDGPVTNWHRNPEGPEAAKLIREMGAELKAALGYMLNAKIDLDTGAPKRTALRTIEGGITRLRDFLEARARSRVQGEG